MSVIDMQVLIWAGTYLMQPGRNCQKALDDLSLNSRRHSLDVCCDSSRCTCLYMYSGQVPSNRVEHGRGMELEEVDVAYVDGRKVCLADCRDGFLLDMPRNG